MPASPLLSASRYNTVSALVAERAVREAYAKRKRHGAVAQIVIAHQVTEATLAENATALMLAEQGITAPAEASLVAASFTTESAATEAMLSQVETDWQFNRLIESLVQDAGRSAQSASMATRNVEYVRHVNPPSCARCAVLSGRVYRYTTGFPRHPGCDCTMVPVTVASPDYTTDPVELMRQGKVTGLSKADTRAINDGADFNQVVNVRRNAAGLRESGRALERRGRLTPEAIYRQAGSDHEQVLSLLKANGYTR